MKWAPADCKPGDMIRVRLGSIYHYGIFVSEDEVIAFGLPPVERYKDDPRRLTVLATDIDVFSCGYIVERGEPDRAERKKRFSAKQTVQRARNRLGETGYDLLHNNCEHFANECAFGEHKCTIADEARERWRSRPICDVYVAAIPYESAEEIYPPERAKEIESAKNEDLRRARESDWRLLRFAAKRSLGIDLDEAKFRKKLGGKWICDKFEFSLTHTKTAVAVAVSNKPVGVDMEFTEEISERMSPDRLGKIRERFFTENEKKTFPDTAEGFAECFTKKEAIFKRAGKGSFHPSRTDATGDDCKTFRLKNGAVISVCSEHSAAVRVYEVTADGASAAKAERV